MSVAAPTLGGDLALVHELERIQVKAVAEVTSDLGLWTAVISTASIDREGDRVSPAGVVAALKKWIPLGKKVPLLWNHSSAPEDAVGFVDPATAKVIGDEVHVSGWCDQGIERGRSVFRLMKSGVVGFSYGYIPLLSTPRKGGGRNLDAIDIWEITATCGPMNADSRVTSWKATSAPPRRRHLAREPLPLAQLDAWAREVEVEWASSDVGYERWVPPPWPDQEPELTTRELRKRCEAEQMESGSGVGDYESKALPTRHGHAAMVERARLDMLAVLDGDA